MAEPLEFGGEESFRAAPTAVFEALTVPEAIAATIPDLVSSEQVDDHTLRCVVRPGFSFIRGTLKLTISLSDRQPPERATMTVDAKGIGAGMRMVSQLEVAPAAGGGSLLKWKANVTERTGLLAAISAALVRGAADNVVRSGWQRVRQRLGE